MGNEHFLDDKSNQTGNQTANRTEGGEQCKERQTAEQGSAPSVSRDQKHEAKRETVYYAGDRRLFLRSAVTAEAETSNAPRDYAQPV